MSYKEALEDGILFLQNKQGYNTYFVPCHICGASVPNWGYRRNIKYTCENCRNKLIEKAREDKNEDLKKRRFENAIKRLSKVVEIEKYKNAISNIEKILYTRGWFQSTEEIMVAIELKKRNVKFIHQYKIENYKIDFLLPEIKVILEIDGVFHNKEKDENRDEILKYKFGDEWEIIRIKTDLINENISKLTKAINRIVAYRKSKKIQEKMWYEKRQRERY